MTPNESDEPVHVGKMLDISDEDAAAVIGDVAAAVTAHPLMSGVVRELAAKYGKKAILAGMMLARAFEANERAIVTEVRGDPDNGHFDEGVEDE